ncbi:cytochrome b/b6 domain-containing protein [Thioalkalivibrio sp. HK1]|uniref:cytochrome b/b6 domain-containing protein n=1 Tax=Thioalkalivibrio sp. HK1 TaxID=1469245 RepID=UPI0004725688|nr:cytochrome b/b6 domain-containing protein [Thioalkalivibrio sp. HK1]
MKAKADRPASSENRRPDDETRSPLEGADKPASFRVWDRPTRIFHWLLAFLFVLCYISGDRGHFDIHLLAGQALTVLVLTRILWGFLGSDSALFRNFLRPPQEIVAYLSTMFFRSQPDRAIGHNPLGGLAVAAMLLLLMVHCALGIFAENVDGYASGPLAFLIDYEKAQQIAKWHEETANALLVLVALHLAAILFHLLYKRENLIPAMLTGRTAIERSAVGGIKNGDPIPSLRFASELRALVLLILVAVSLFGGFALAERFL